MPKDSYGEYQLLTGLEAPGRCFWCGCEVGKRRRYCCEDHSDEYYRHFFWASAAGWCVVRAHHFCADCGGTATLAHHIIPLGGAFRPWNILNRPENLAALCYSCHGRRHAQKPIDGRLEKALARGQLVLMEV